MLTTVRVALRMYRGSEFFFKLVEQEYPRHSASYMLIRKAYYVAFAEFIRKKRDTGEPYFTHLEAVGIIVSLQSMRKGKKDPNLVAAALLHDIAEMIDGWDVNRIAREFNHDVAMLVIRVTKPKITRSRRAIQRRNQTYHAQFKDASDRVVQLKLSDVLHNLATLWFTKKEKRRRKLREYSSIYLPIAKERDILFKEIRKEIKKLDQSLKR